MNNFFIIFMVDIEGRNHGRNGRGYRTRTDGGDWL